MLLKGPSILDQENSPHDELSGIPEDGIVVRQVQYAWLWSSMPIIILATIFYFLPIVEPLIVSIFLVVVIIPRYFTWRKTAYVITDQFLTYNRHRIPISSLEGVTSNPGLFGRTLGYEAIEIKIRAESLGATGKPKGDSEPPTAEAVSFKLTYIPSVIGLASHIQALIDKAGTQEKE